MKKFFNSKKACPAKLQRSGGFSLLELLIVITIVGVLTSIVLSSVSQGRARAYDSKVKQQLSSFRTAAEIYFNNQSPPSYGPDSASCATGMFSNMQAANGTPGIYIAEGNLPANTQIACSANDTSYAVKATLYAGNEYWCVDSRGASRLVSGEIGEPETICP